MRRPIKVRHRFVPGMDSRSRNGVRTSDLLLAVVLVALLGAFCLAMATGEVGAVWEVAASTPLAPSS